MVLLRGTIRFFCLFLYLFYIFLFLSFLGQERKKEGLIELEKLTVVKNPTQDLKKATEGAGEEESIAPIVTIMRANRGGGGPNAKAE